MSRNNKKKLSLAKVFLNENEISRRYGLDKDTPKNVYVPDMTQNRIVAYTGEEPLEEDLTECGCGEPQGPHLHRVGAPGGPNLGGSMMGGPSLDPTAMPHNEPGEAIVLFDVDNDPLQSEGGLKGLEADGDNWEDDQEAEEDDDFDSRNYDEPSSSDKHSNDWKPRPRHEAAVHESFGDFAGDDWLDIG